MVHYVTEPKEVALALLGEDIPAIGPRVKNKNEAIKVVRWYIRAIDLMTKNTRRSSCRVMFVRQPDGRYTLLIKGATVALETLCNLDEVMLQRFRKAFKRNLFILTCFFEEEGKLECLALTEGLGAVLYTPN